MAYHKILTLYFYFDPTLGPSGAEEQTQGIKQHGTKEKQRHRSQTGRQETGTMNPGTYW